MSDDFDSGARYGRSGSRRKCRESLSVISLLREKRLFVDDDNAGQGIWSGYGKAVKTVIGGEVCREKLCVT